VTNTDRQTDRQTDTGRTAYIQSVATARIYTFNACDVVRNMTYSHCVRRAESGVARGAIAPLLIMIKGQDVYFAPPPIKIQEKNTK